MEKPSPDSESRRIFIELINFWQGHQDDLVAREVFQAWNHSRQIPAGRANLNSYLLVDTEQCKTDWRLFVLARVQKCLSSVCVYMHACARGWRLMQHLGVFLNLSPLSVLTFKAHLILCVCMFCLHECMYVDCVHVWCPLRSEDGCWCHWNWTSGWSWATMLILRIEPGFSARATTAHNHSAEQISPPSILYFLKRCLIF